ncbi:BolA-like domain containing protein [Tylopilus felleus]
MGLVQTVLARVENDVDLVPERVKAVPQAIIDTTASLLTNRRDAQSLKSIQCAGRMLPTRPLPTAPLRHLLGQLRRTMATATSESRSPGPVETAMHDKLTALLQPSRLTITNESHLHRHHAAMRAQDGGNGETHFAVQIISEEFKGKSTLQRHRLVYSALSDELAQGLHALSLKTTTPDDTQQLAAGQAE